MLFESQGTLRSLAQEHHRGTEEELGCPAGGGQNASFDRGKNKIEHQFNLTFGRLLNNVTMLCHGLLIHE